MRHAFITYRSHPNEQELTELFINIILQKIKQDSDAYCIVQEDFGTPSRHIHIFFTHTQIDNNHFKAKYLLHKKAKELWESLKDLQTNVVYTGKNAFKGSSSGGTSYGLDSQWDTGLSDNPDPKYHIGYCLKNPDSVPDIKGYDQKYINESQKYYSACEGIKLLNTTKNIWRILKPQNAHSYITDFCKKNAIIIDDDLDEILLQKNMARQGISTVELSTTKYDHIIRDLIYYHVKNAKKHEPEVPVYNCNVCGMLPHACAKADHK